MKKQILLVLSLVFIFTNIVSAQNRTVTNGDLQKHRAKRLAAERDLRENYEKLGFPSPEELQRQIEQSRRERAELSARIQAENLEKERLALDAQIVENEARTNNYQYQNDIYSRRTDDYFSNYAPYGFFSFPNSGFQNRRNNRFNRGNRRGAERIEYRNNLPVIIRQPQRILAPAPIRSAPIRVRGQR